jgi:hypothetical protein
MQFYQEFAEAASKAKRPVRAILVYPTNERDTPEFLHEHHIEFAEVVAVDDVKQIPAIYLMDTFGVVRGYWKGSFRDYD